jgi:hypothetical protein
VLCEIEPAGVPRLNSASPTSDAGATRHEALCMQQRDLIHKQGYRPTVAAQAACGCVPKWTSGPAPTAAGCRWNGKRSSRQRH